MTNKDSTKFYADLDTAKNKGRGSCCTGWTFLGLFFVIFITGLGVLIYLTKW